MSSQKLVLDGDNKHFKSRWKEENLLMCCGMLATGSGIEDMLTISAFMGLPEPSLRYVVDYIHDQIINVNENVMKKNLMKEMRIEIKKRKIASKRKEGDSDDDDIPLSEKFMTKPIALTCSVDMGWQKRSSGHSYSSLSGVMFFIGVHTRKPIYLEVLSKICSGCKKGLNVDEHKCVKNYDGSSKGMEAHACRIMLEKFYNNNKGVCYIGALVSDDDSSMKAHCQHKSNINKKGCLNEHVPVPKWYADPTHRCKVVAKQFFQLATAAKSVSFVTKTDALRMKMYYGWFIKQNRDKDIKWMLEHIMAPLEHLFNDHHLCDSNWCPVKRREDNDKTNIEQVSDNVATLIDDSTSLPNVVVDYCLDDKDKRGRNKQNEDSISGYKKTATGYYRCKKKHGDMYTQMANKYKIYITEEMLKMTLHFFDTQKNEGMNMAIMKYAPKTKTYCKTLSLMARVSIAASVNSTGHETFWTTVLRRMNVKISPELQSRLIRLDTVKAAKSAKESTVAYKNKRSRGKYEDIRKQREDQAKSALKGQDYGFHCHQRKATENMCTLAVFGCEGLGGHKTSQSKKCKFNQIHMKIKDKSLSTEGIRKVLIEEGLLQKDFYHNELFVSSENIVKEKTAGKKVTEKITAVAKTDQSSTNSIQGLNSTDRMIFLDHLEPSDSD